MPMSTPVADASSEQTRKTLEPGTVVADRYRVETKLGEGGMGAVYRAEHVHMRKAVALKVLHTDVNATQEAVARFEREAVAAGNIAHPNVAAATDFGQLPDGSFFLVLEYVDGKSVRALLNEEAVDPTRALHIVYGIASALSAAHALGIVHRDLKPENVMLVARPTTLPNGTETRETVKVLDFGIAKVDVEGMSPSKRSDPAPGEGAASRRAPLTRIGAIFGTPDYMSPEQGLGQPVDGRSDLYTIGIILYELLTGRRPFQGGTVTIIRQHVLDEAPPIAPEIASGVDPRVLDLLHRLMAKSPENRVQSAEILCNELEAIMAGAAPAPVVVPVATAPALVTAPAPMPVGHAPTVLADAAAPHPSAPPLASSQPPPPVRRRTPLAVILVGVALFVSVLLGATAFALHLRSSDTAPAAAGTREETPTAQSATAAGTVEAPAVAETEKATATKRTAFGAEKSAAKAPAPTAAPAAPVATTASPATPAAVAAPATPEASPAVAPATKAEHGGKADKKAPPGHDSSKKGGGRNTGPGGIYIPPPSTWFK
jgi:tRNA A-37 threonylcarbamoyl transferase component Bud32